jgi:hypothetical protein
MWSQKLLPSHNRAINKRFVSCAVFDWVVEGIIKASTPRKPLICQARKEDVLNAS